MEDQINAGSKDMIMRRRRIYRGCLYVILVSAVAGLLFMGYKHTYNQIPANIKLKAGVAQTLDLHVPVNGEIVKVIQDKEALTVSGQGQANVPGDAIYIDLSNPVIMKADKLDSYQMNLRLFGIIPIKQVNIEVIQDMMLTPAGLPIGIYMKTEGVLVIGVGEFDGADGNIKSPAQYLLKSGDYIMQVNGEEIESKKSFKSTVGNSAGEKLILTVRRGEEEFDISIKPEKNRSEEYKIGIWIRDNAQGVGTLTFVDADGHFGALGHGISDVDTSTLMLLKGGTLYKTEIIAIRKGVNGSPGEMTGMIDYSERNILGEITSNSNEGIFGICNEKLTGSIYEGAIPVGLKQEIEQGAAQILCSVEGEPKYYDVEIKEIYLDHENVNRGILFTVTDPELLALTGGIVQGMSGAPMVQNGKLIGAVTHVLVQDAASGYGIFIENMLLE